MRAPPTRSAMAVSAAFTTIWLASTAQAQQNQTQVAQPTQTASTLKPIVVDASKITTASDNVNDPNQIVNASKTGTPLGDLPMSVQEVPRAILDEQGATSLQEAVRNG